MNSKRYVFKSLLKTETDCAFLIIRGSVFQSLGAAIEKARSPYVQVVDLGTVTASLAKSNVNCVTVHNDSLDLQCKMEHIHSQSYT